MFPWTDFYVGFLSNLAADLIVGVILFILLTNIPEKKKEKENLKIGLGLYFKELEINKKRINAISIKLDNLNTNEVIESPLSLSDAAWKMVQEARLLTKIKNTRLIHHIFQLQESINVTNLHLREIQRFLNDYPSLGSVNKVLIARAKASCKNTGSYVDETLELLGNEIQNKLK